jgi:hypothetical protein
VTVVGEASVTVRFDTANATNNLKRDLDSATKQAGDSVNRNLGDAGKRAGIALDRNLGDSFKRVGGQATKFITLPIVGFLGLATKAAAEEGQEMEVLANNLRQAAGATDEQIGATEKFITTTQNATGVSDGQLRPALARLVQATKDVGLSQELLSVALDVSKARGLDLTQVSTALGRAYLGNTAALGRLGVATKDAEGNALSFRQVVEQLAESTGGTAARAADTAAGRAAILRARFADLQEDIGTRLLPTMERVVRVVGSVVDGFGRLPESMQNMIILGAVTGAAVGPVLRLTGTMITLGTTIRAAAAGGGALATSIKGLGTAAVAGAAVLGLVTAFKALDEALERSARGGQNIDRLVETMLDLEDTGVRALRRLAAEGRIDLDRLDAAFDKTAGRGVEFERALSETDRALVRRGGRKTVARELDDIDQALARIVREGNPQAATAEIRQLAEALDRTPAELLPFLDAYRASLQGVQTQNKLTAVSQEQQTAASEDQGGALDDLAESTEKPKTAFEQLTEQIDAFSSALDEALGVQLSADEAASQWQESIEELRKSLQENGNVVGTSTEKQRALGEQLRSTVAAAQAEVEAFARSGRTSADAAVQKQGLIDRLNGLRQLFPQLKGPIDTYIATVRAIPAQATTTVVADTGPAITSLTAFDRYATYVARTRTATIRLLTENAPGPGRPAARAAGGLFFAGQQLLVGETGRELVRFSSGGEVLNNATTERLLAALGSTISVTSPTSGNVVNLGPGAALVRVDVSGVGKSDAEVVAQVVERAVDRRIRAALAEVGMRYRAGAGRY